MRDANARFSLARLLSKQAGPFKKLPEFARLVAILRDSHALARVRLNRRAFRLLDEPRLELRHLPDFRATYRLPDSPFFRVFLEMKWDRSKASAARRASLRERVDAIMETSPSYARGMLKYLAGTERTCSLKAALFVKRLYPRTMKRAREMAAFPLARWTAAFRAHIRLLRGSYRTIVLPDDGFLMAAMVLECLPDPKTGKAKTTAEIKASFRRVSKECHPDLGGDPARFRLLVKARDALLG